MNTLPGVSRPAWITALVFGGFVFLVIAFLLARGLGGAGTERSQVLALLEAQARGDAPGVLAGLDACRSQPACVVSTTSRTRRLARPGEVEILSFEPSVRLTMGEHLGSARVAWRAGAGLPIVQCVRVRREGPLRGGGVELLSLSEPIPRQSSCR